jgi:hypothetical protein
MSTKNGHADVKYERLLNVPSICWSRQQGTPHAVVVREMCKWGSSGSRSTMLFGMLPRNPVADATILLVNL